MCFIRSSFVVFLMVGTMALAKTVDIRGNRRLDDATIKAHALRDGGRLPSEQQMIKNLFATGLFKDIKVKSDGQKTVITVEENPMVRQRHFEGNKALKDDVLKTETTMLKRHIFSAQKVRRDVSRLLDLYRYKGYFQAQITPEIIKHDQNRVDLIFRIQEGRKAHVDRIIFIGNEHFSHNRLESVIHTKESRWYRFFNTDDIYDPDRMAYDQELLRAFYADKGYLDFMVKSSVAELSLDRRFFTMTYAMEEGGRYRYGDIKVTSRLKKIQPTMLMPFVTLSKGGWYSKKEVEKVIESLSHQLGIKGYAFVRIQPLTQKNTEKKTVDLVFEVQESPKVTIEKIQVSGNNRTNESVIRREIQLYEGDAFDAHKAETSERRLKNLGFFKNVTLHREPGTHPDQMRVHVEVEEDATGEIALAGGYRTGDGLVASLSFSETNFQGKGQHLSTMLKWGKHSKEFDIGFMEPYFMGRNIAVGFDVFHMSQNKFFHQKFDHKKMGFSLNMGYNLSEYLGQQWVYALQKEHISGIGDNVSSYIKEDHGSNVVSSLAHTLSYDRRDNRIEPTQGYVISMTNELAGLGGSVRYFKNVFSGAWYYPLMDDVVFGLSGSCGHVAKLGKRIRIADRFNLGGDSLRGFDTGEVGPRDQRQMDPLGGRMYYKATAETLFPVGMPRDFNVKGAAFVDMGSVFDAKDLRPHVQENNRLRMSIGFGLRWRSPMGPLRIDFGFPILKHKQDKKQHIQFGFTTKF